MVELTSRNLKGLAELLGPGTGGDEHGEVGLLDHLVDGGLGELLELGAVRFSYLELGGLGDGDLDSLQLIVKLWLALEGDGNLLLGKGAGFVVDLEVT